jgi:very-short-patch-repair endonuclease
MESHHRPIPKHRLRNAKAMRHIATDAEKKLWRLLRSRQLDGVKFRRQGPVGKYIVDFVCHERRLIVEADTVGNTLKMSETMSATDGLESPAIAF